MKSNVLCVAKHYKFSRIDKNNILHKFGKFGFKIYRKTDTQKGDCEQIWKYVIELRQKFVCKKVIMNCCLAVIPTQS